MLRYIFLFFIFLFFSNADEKVNERSFVAPTFNVVDLSARRFSDGTVLLVSGNIINDSFRSTSGRVIVYVMLGSTTILTLEGKVNKGVPFAHLQKGFFELNTNINPKQKLDTVLVEYIEDEYIERRVMDRK